jgi:hypothetical protein
MGYPQYDCGTLLLEQGLCPIFHVYTHGNLAFAIFSSTTINLRIFASSEVESLSPPEKNSCGVFKNTKLQIV